MSLYSDAMCVIDTEFIACVHTFEGTGSQDGVYGLAYHLVSGNSLKRMWVEYPDKQTRDAAFARLRELMECEMEEGEGEEL